MPLNLEEKKPCCSFLELFRSGLLVAIGVDVVVFYGFIPSELWMESPLIVLQCMSILEPILLGLLVFAILIR